MISPLVWNQYPSSTAPCPLTPLRLWYLTVVTLPLHTPPSSRSHFVLARLSPLCSYHPWPGWDPTTFMASLSFEDILTQLGPFWNTIYHISIFFFLASPNSCWIEFSGRARQGPNYISNDSILKCWLVKTEMFLNLNTFRPYL